MAPATEPLPSDAFPPLTRAVTQRVVLFCGGHLPPPLGPTADDRALRDNAALAEVAALEPANDAELTLAMRCVASGAWADDQLRLALLYADDFGRSQQIMKQYALMMRTASGTQSVLLRVQTARQRREKDLAGSERDAAAGRGVLTSLMETRGELAAQLEANTVRAAAARVAVAEAAEAKAAAVAEAKAAAAAAKAAGAGSRGTQWSAWPLAHEEPPVMTPEEKRQDDLLFEADRYATIYPMRTRLIRRFGKLPDNCGIEQPEPEMLEAIRTGDRYSLRWADGLSKAEANQNAGKDRFLCEYEDAADREAAGPEAVVPEPVGSG